MIFDFHNIIQKCILTTKTQFYELFLVESWYFFKYAFSSIRLNFLNPHNKSPNIFALYIFGIKCFLHP